MEVSNKAWGAADKAKLPAECFLHVPDKEKRSTWGFPYREGAGAVDPKTGVHEGAGPVNVGAVRAILAAVGGARTADASAVKGKIDAIVKELREGGYARAMVAKAYFMMELGEAFISLDQEIRNAVKEEFGQDSYLQDFSDSEAIFEMPVDGNALPGPDSRKRQLFAISYVVAKDGQIVFGTEDPVPVERAVVYEPIDTQEKLLTAVVDLLDGANMIEKGKVGKFIDQVAKGVAGSKKVDNPWAVAVATAQGKFGKKKVSRAMSKAKGGKRLTKEEIEAEQTRAEKHRGIEKRFRSIEKKHSGRNERKSYLAHKIAVKHAKIAQDAEETLQEYGIPGMKWGQHVSIDRMIQRGDRKIAAAKEKKAYSRLGGLVKSIGRGKFAYTGGQMKGVVVGGSGAQADRMAARADARKTQAHAKEVKWMGGMKLRALQKQDKAKAGERAKTTAWMKSRFPRHK